MTTTTLPTAVAGNEAATSCNVSLVEELSYYCVTHDCGGGGDHPDVCALDKDYYDAHCYPVDPVFSVVAGCWCLVNAVVGFSGNLLTLLAIPHARRTGRFGFGRRDGGCDCTTLFILNLALSDLLYCSFNLPLYAVQYLMQEWPLGLGVCYAFAAFRYINAFADWMSLAFIAVSRCVGLVRRDWARRYLTGRNGLAVIAAIWAYALGLVSLVLAGVVGEFGYNCRSGKCDFIGADDDPVDPHRLYYGVGFTVPFAIIVVSYFVIWCYVRRCAAATYLKKASASSDTRDRIENRELRMTWTLLLICLCYLVCVGPISVVNMVDPTAELVNLHLAMFCIYWMQYSLNFFIYAYRSENFRTAYVGYLNTVWFKMKRCCSPYRDERRRSTWMTIHAQGINVPQQHQHHQCGLEDEGEGGDLRQLAPYKEGHQGSSLLLTGSPSSSCGRAGGFLQTLSLSVTGGGGNSPGSHRLDVEAAVSSSCGGGGGRVTSTSSSVVLLKPPPRKKRRKKADDGGLILKVTRLEQHAPKTKKCNSLVEDDEYRPPPPAVAGNELTLTVKIRRRSLTL